MSIYHVMAVSLLTGVVHLNVYVEEPQPRQQRLQQLLLLLPRLLQHQLRHQLL